MTECPYCGHRLRKRAPDIKSIKKREGKARKRQQSSERRKQLVGRLSFGRAGGDKREVPAYLQSSGPPKGITVMIVLAVGMSLAVRVQGFPVQDFMVLGGLGSQPWKLITAPLIHLGFGYGFAALLGCAIFGVALERRFGTSVLVAVWLICGAVGVSLALLIEAFPIVHGANGVALGLLAAWLTVVVVNEDLRDTDTYGLIAVGAVLAALPLVTNEANIWAAIGGLAAGGLCGFALSRRPT